MNELYMALIIAKIEEIERNNNAAENASMLLLGMLLGLIPTILLLIFL